MFWNWFEPWGFMNTEPGKHEAQWESLSQRLFGRTFWGDYGGDIVTRFYYTELLKNYPNVVSSIEAAHGQGLVLSGIMDGYNDELREVIRFLAYFDPESREYGYGEMWDADGFSDWEWQAIDKEMNEGWWAEYTQRELVDYFSDWDGNTIVPDINTQEWADFIWEFYRENDENYPYFEGADSLIVPGFGEVEVAAEWLLERYARSLTEAGNPEPLDFAEVVAATWNSNLAS